MKQRNKGKGKLTGKPVIVHAVGSRRRRERPLVVPNKQGCPWMELKL
jgi:hypothetical protein